MGDVYEAWDTVLARPVALKILRHLEPAAMIRFMQEAQLHARLDSPNICRIYDVDAKNGAPRIAMQLVRGPNLEDASPDLRLDEIITIMLQVTDAIHAAHQLKLIHRDLKPSNILLQWAETGGWIPYVCDFGLAMSLDGPSVTQPLAMTGTPAYMAPEQVRGDRAHICPATDVYGIGSTLYFTLTGRPPCVSTVTAEVLRVKRERRFPDPRSLEPEIPPDLETILLKCLQPDPANRYATAAELAEELRRFQEGRTIQTLPQGTLSMAWTWSRRHWPLLATAAAVLGLATGLGAWVRNDHRRLARQAELGQYFTLEAANLEQALSNERMLPVHDLRPAYAEAHARMQALRESSATLGPEAEGPLHYVLGRTHFFIRDFATASTELDQAWSAGFRPPEAAFLLARLHARAYLKACDEATFSATPLPAAATASLAKAEELFRQSRGLNRDPFEFAEATLAYAKKDYARAAGLAQACVKAQAWHLESAALASLSLSALAAEEAGQGHGTEAKSRFTEALAIARNALARSQNQEGLHHAQCRAALGLAALALDRGDLPLASLAPLEEQAAQALRFAPEAPEAQSDWLRVRTLKVARMMDLGQDPSQALNEGLQFFWTRTREPRAVELRVDHMVLYFLQAQVDLAHGKDPMPALAEALKDAGPALGERREFFGDLLNFKARLEASRQQDPRPTVDALLQRFELEGETRSNHGLCEIAAEACLIKAEWEFTSGLDALPSLRRSQALLQHALQIKPASAPAHALLGQSQVLEARALPARRQWLTAQAQEQLRWAVRLNPTAGQNARLKLKLSRLLLG